MKVTIIPAWLSRKLTANDLPLKLVCDSKELQRLLNKEELYFLTEAQTMNNLEYTSTPMLSVWSWIRNDAGVHQMSSCENMAIRCMPRKDEDEVVCMPRSFTGRDFDWLLSPEDMNTQYSLSIGMGATLNEKLEMVFGDLTLNSEGNEFNKYGFLAHLLEPDHVGLVVTKMSEVPAAWQCAEHVLDVLNTSCGNDAVFGTMLFDMYAKLKP